MLQRRGNHDTFSLRRVEYETHIELAERFGIEELPTLLVIEEKRVQARLERPRGCVQIAKLLAPWLK